MVCQIEKVDRIQLLDRQKERYLVECKVRSKLDREKDIQLTVGQIERQTVGQIERETDEYIKNRQLDIQMDRKLDRQVKRQTESKVDS